jgi:hypothetical protein
MLPPPDDTEDSRNSIATRDMAAAAAEKLKVKAAHPARKPQSGPNALARYW